MFEIIFIVVLFIVAVSMLVGLLTEAGVKRREKYKHLRATAMRRHPSYSPRQNDWFFAKVG